MLKKLVTLVLVATLSINASCGTLTGWTRDEPFKEAVIIGNAGLFLYAIIPGVLGFIVDGYNGKLNRQTTPQPTKQTVATTIEKSPQQPTKQNVETAVEKSTKLNHEDPNKKWFFDVGSNTCDFCIAFFGLPLVMVPDIGVGYYLNNKIATSVNIGHTLHGFQIDHNDNASFYIENRWLYNFINRYKQPTATKSYYFKVYSGVGFGLQDIDYYNGDGRRSYTTPSIAFIVGTKLSKRLTLEYIYRYSIKKNTYNKKNSQSYILKFRF